MVWITNDMREDFEHVHKRERESEKNKIEKVYTHTHSHTHTRTLFLYTTVLKRTVKTHIRRVWSLYYCEAMIFLFKQSVRIEGRIEERKTNSREIISDKSQSMFFHCNWMCINSHHITITIGIRYGHRRWRKSLFRSIRRCKSRRENLMLRKRLWMSVVDTW